MNTDILYYYCEKSKLNITVFRSLIQIINYKIDKECLYKVLNNKDTIPIDILDIIIDDLKISQDECKEIFGKYIKYINQDIRKLIYINRKCLPYYIHIYNYLYKKIGYMPENTYFSDICLYGNIDMVIDMLNNGSVLTQKLFIKCFKKLEKNNLLKLLDYVEVNKELLKKMIDIKRK